MSDKLIWPDNVWMGVSVEDATQFQRIAHLREVPAKTKTRFPSCEPLLGPLAGIDLKGIDWVIAGAESGPRHRAVQPGWVTGLRDACQAQDVAFYFKQWGGRTPKACGRQLDGRIWDAMPATV